MSAVIIMHRYPANSGVGIVAPSATALVQVRSTLASVETPLGEEFVPDMTSVYRARQQDLNQTMTYPVTFTRNAAGRVVLDRRRNTADLVAQYYNMTPEKIAGRIDWDMENPNDLSLRLPRGGDVETRVTRRLQVRQPSHRCHVCALKLLLVDSGQSCVEMASSTRCREWFEVGGRRP